MAGHSDPLVLFPTGSFYPAQTGGPDNSVYWLTKALMHSGVRVEVVSTDRGLDPETPRNRWLDREFARVIYTTNGIHYLPFRLLREALGRLRKADVLHLTMIFYPASFLLAALNRLFYHKPVVWSIRGDLDPHMMKRSRWKKRPIAALVRYWLGKRVTFHATCAAEARYAREVLGDNIRIVQLTNYMELPEKVETEKEKYLIYLGRIDEKKAIDRLIEALPKTKLAHSGYHLKIVGDHRTSYGRELIRLVDRLQLNDLVEFVGHAAGRAKQELLSAAHFLVMPSHTENFGIVVAEALAQGTPAVASIHTPWRILEDRRAGYWVDNTVERLAECVDHILQLNKEDYEAMRARTRPLVTEELDVYANVGKWKTTYRDLLAAAEKKERESSL